MADPGPHVERRRSSETSPSGVAQRDRTAVRRRGADQALAQSERRYRSLITAIAELAWMTDASGESLELLGEPELLERHRAAWRSINGRPVIHPEDTQALRAVWAVALANRERFEFGYRMQRADGEWRQVVTTGLPVLDAQGRVAEWVGVVRDVTDQRRVQEQLRQTQKMEAVGQLAAGVAHDFNNLLTIIRGCGELIEPYLPGDSLALTLLVDLRDAGERATALTRQLLTFSRREVVTPIVVDARTVVRGTERMLRRLFGEACGLEVETAAEAVLVRIDARQLEQVIVNLALNGRDAMPDGGVLAIRAHTETLDEVLSSGSLAGSYAVLAVRDTGEGMTPDVQARIFEPFFTTKSPGHGTGLGLSTVHDIVTQAGGAVRVASAPGSGTTFRVYLPEVAAEHKADTEVLESAPPRGTETVLVVEDDPAVRALICTVLEREGYVVLAATGGTEGIDLVNDYAGEIHLLVSDVILPGIGGRMVADRIREARPGLRVLFVSGYTDEILLRHGVARGDVAFLQKPFAPGELALKVRQVLSVADETT